MTLDNQESSHSPTTLAVVPVAVARTGGGGGAPRGNRNALRHGATAVAVGKFPRGAEWIGRQCLALRKLLRQELLQRDGKVSGYSECVLNSACVHEARRLLVARWLRLEGDKLSVMERANLLDRIGRASDARDAALRRLKLHLSPDTGALWDQVHGRSSPGNCAASHLGSAD